MNTTPAYFDDPDVQHGLLRGPPRRRRVSLALDGTRCSRCFRAVERALWQQPGTSAVQVDPVGHVATVTWDHSRTPLSALLDAIASAGFRAAPFEPTRREALWSSERELAPERLVFAAIVGMVVMQFSLATYLRGAAEPYPLWVLIGRATVLVATAALLAYPGRTFFSGAAADLRHRRLGMDVPVALGLAAAFLGSAWATIAGHGEVYFDSIAMFVLMLGVARRVELGGRRQATGYLDHALRHAPVWVSRLDADGEFRAVPASRLAAGDVVEIEAGEPLPVDGVLISGPADFHESALRGEPTPITRAAGETIAAGCHPLDRRVRLRVSAAGGATTLARLDDLVRAGLDARPPSLAVADRVAAWIVPAVIALAVATALVWGLLEPARALPATVAVLIATCPCALALAAPLALALGAARLLDAGVLPLRMSAVETLARATTVVFDKTGTLTEGRPRLNEIVCATEVDEAEARGLAAALEGGMPHPVARALSAADSASAPFATATDARYRPGEGVTGTVAGRRLFIGRPDRALEGRHCEPRLQAAIQRAGTTGVTCVALADPARVLAVYVLDDPLRPGAAHCVEALRALGIRRVVIATGDSPARAARFEHELGVDAAQGGLHPEDKLRLVQSAQALGQRVLMVGDGLNDAGASAIADAALTLDHGPSLTKAGSDGVILEGDLNAVVAARRLATRIRRIIKQNLGWALAYNLLALPAAAAGALPPWGAALGMSISSLVVVGNSLRLRMPARGRASASLLRTTRIRRSLSH
ncbi:MAG: heavy metal translocating P-type ATPase [Pseudomonadota bacterium]